MAENKKMHGGLIRRDPRVVKDRNGHVTTQHWDGRKDVQINAERATIVGRAKNVGGES